MDLPSQRSVGWSPDGPDWFARIAQKSRSAGKMPGKPGSETKAARLARPLKSRPIQPRPARGGLNIGR